MTSASASASAADSAADSASTAPEFWLFGSGSLIWKPPPHVDRRVPGWVTGYVRRFWQASEDHRGTPDSPGRVVTLVSKPHWLSSFAAADPHRPPPDRVWGVAYRVPADRVPEVRDYLDLREINGYSIHHAPFHPAAAADADDDADADAAVPPFSALVYIGTPDNDQFVGPQHPDQLARRILRCRGPSGRNRDYLFSLHAALQELGPDAAAADAADAHVADLVDRVRALERDAEPDLPPQPREPATAFRQHGSTAEAEEIEKT